MGGRYSKWLLRRQRPCCLRPDSSLYIRCPPSLPPRSPSNSIHTGEFPPPLVHLSLHSSLLSPPTNGNNNTQQCNNQQFTGPSLLQPPIQTLRLDLLSRASSVGPSSGKKICLNHAKECDWQVFGVVSPPCLPGKRRRRRTGGDARISASISCCRRSWFWITAD